MQAGKKRKKQFLDYLESVRKFKKKSVSEFQKEYKERTAIRKMIIEKNIDPKKQVHQTISMTLTQALLSQNRKKKIEKLNIVVNGLNHARLWTFLFLNWYSESSGDPFPLGNTETNLVFVLRYFICDEVRGRLLLHSDIHVKLQAFSCLYPRSRSIDLRLFKLHSNQLNLLAKNMTTNIDLYHKQFTSYYMKNVLTKKKISVCIVKEKEMKDGDEVNKEEQKKRRERNKSIENYYTSKVTFEWYTVIPVRPFVRNNINAIYKIMWLRTEIEKMDHNNLFSDISFYPRSSLGNGHIPFDLVSFQNAIEKDTMWKHHFSCFSDEKMEKMTLTTDGYSVHFTLKVRKKQHFYIEKGHVKPIKDCPNGKTDFDDIKKCKQLPINNGLRFMTSLQKTELQKLNAFGRTSCDPGKKLIFSAMLSDGSFVSMSSRRHGHLMMTPQFQKFDQREQKKIRRQMDDLSSTRSLEMYLYYFNKYYTSFRSVFTGLDYKRWRFRRFGLQQKVNEIISNELQTGKKTVDNLLFDDHLRKKQKVGKVNSKRNVIYWGDGSVGHNVGNPPVPNRKLVYALSKKNLVIITPEFKTSLCCSKCHYEMRNVTTTKEHSLRLRQCPHCALVQDRDINGCDNIDQVALHFISFGEKPVWQQQKNSYCT